MTKSPTRKNGPDWSISSKWHDEILSYGFTQVPNALLIYATKLKLKPSEFFILVNIESFRWDGKKKPYPSLVTLSNRIGIVPRAVSRNITSLIDKECLRREKRMGTSNKYDFYPLNKALLKLIRADRKGRIGLTATDTQVPTVKTIIASKEYPRENTKRKRHSVPNSSQTSTTSVSEILDRKYGRLTGNGYE